MASLRRLQRQSESKICYLVWHGLSRRPIRFFLQSQSWKKKVSISYLLGNLVFLWCCTTYYILAYCLSKKYLQLSQQNLRNRTLIQFPELVRKSYDFRMSQISSIDVVRQVQFDRHSFSLFFDRTSFQTSCDESEFHPKKILLESLVVLLINIYAFLFFSFVGKRKKILIDE